MSIDAIKFAYISLIINTSQKETILLTKTTPKSFEISKLLRKHNMKLMNYAKVLESLNVDL